MKITFWKKIFWVSLICLPLLAMKNDTKTLHILVLGDSLTDGYGVNREDAWPSLLDKQLSQEFTGFRLTNGGTSGATSSSGLQRLKWYSLKDKPDVVILALGSNDGLRGIMPKETRQNIQKMIDYLKQNSVKVLLTGQKIPPSYGADYAQEFEGIFAELAQKNKIPLYPFLLEGVAGETTLNLSDGIHPNEKGHQKMAQAMLEFVKKNLSKNLTPIKG